MKQINALLKRLVLACAVAAVAASVCGAQTPGDNSGRPPVTSENTAAPGKEKAPDKASPLDEELSKTPAGKTVAKFFAAFNSGDLKVMRAFHESFGGDLENAEKDKEFYDQTGGLKLHSLTSSATNKISVLAQAKKDARWITFHFTVDAQEPHGISSINVRPAAAPAAN
jgi:hypothetical protein